MVETQLSVEEVDVLEGLRELLPGRPDLRLKEAIEIISGMPYAIADSLLIRVTPVTEEAWQVFKRDFAASTSGCADVEVKTLFPSTDARVESLFERWLAFPVLRKKLEGRLALVKYLAHETLVIIHGEDAGPQDVYVLQNSKVGLQRVQHKLQFQFAFRPLAELASLAAVGSLVSYAAVNRLWLAARRQARNFGDVPAADAPIEGGQVWLDDEADCLVGATTVLGSKYTMLGLELPSGGYRFIMYNGEVFNDDDAGGPAPHGVAYNDRVVRFVEAFRSAALRFRDGHEPTTRMIP